MFAYVVKRLLTGFLVVALGLDDGVRPLLVRPEEPGQADLRRATAATAGAPPRSSRGTRSGSATTTRSPRSTPSGSRACSWAGDRVRHRPRSTARRPCLGISFITPQPVWEELKERFPATISIAIGACHPLPPRRRDRRRGRRATTRLLRRPALVGGYAVHELDPLLPARPARLPATLCHPLRHLRTWVRLDRRRRRRRLVQPPDAAVARARHLRLDPVHPVLPWGDGRVAERGLHTHGTGQGPATADGDLQARPALGAGAGRHDLRHRLRVPARRARSSPSTSSRSRASAAGVCRRRTTRTCPSSQATVLFGSIIIVLANIIVDVLYSVLDPRVRLT